MNTTSNKHEKLGEGMAYYTNPKIANEIELPISKTPIRFGVKRRNGLSSNSWRVWVEKSDDIYIICRDNMKELKISLHKSGKQHIAFSSDSDQRMEDGSRFWNQWWEPPFDKVSMVVPTFHLLFPSWGLGLTEAIRQQNPKVWDNNQILLDAAESPKATIVSFILTDDSEIHFNTIKQMPSLALGTLDASAGKKLWVLASHVPEGNMKELAAVSIDEVTKLGESKALEEMPDGHIFGLAVSGPTDNGGTYFMPFPARIHRESDELLKVTLIDTDKCHTNLGSNSIFC